MKKLLFVTLLIFVALPAYSKNQNIHKNQKSLPPGLQKKYERSGELPPGWQKKIIKGEVLAPEIYTVAKHYPVNPVDYHLKVIKGTELLRLEDRILRIVNDTRVVLDVIGIN